MTIAAQVKQTVATLKGVRSTIEIFAEAEEDLGTKELLKKNTQRVGTVIDNLERRVKKLEFEEPQYKGF